MSNRKKDARYRLEILSKDEDVLELIKDSITTMPGDYSVDWHYDSSSESETIKINKK